MMLGKIVKHELRLLRKDQTVWLVIACFGLVIGYAVLSRSAEIEKQKTNIKEWPVINERNILRVQNEAREIENKIKAGQYSDQQPLVYNQRNPRYPANSLVATVPLPPSPLAVLAVGRSDLDTLAYRVELNPPPEPRREQTDYPLRTLTGHLDLAFVVLYLYPLFILALSFNLISSEKESGTLALLLSQPLTIRSLVLGKVLARALIIFGSTIAFSAIALLFTRINFRDGSVLMGLLLWLAATTIYGLFWFGLALLANHWARSSASAALSLMVGWFVLTIFLPATINLAATLIFPAPSRTELINERRSVNFELAQESDKRFDERVRGFLADHPQYPSATDYKYDRSALLWMDTAQRHIETAKTLQPLTRRFDQQLQRQRRFSKYLSVLSPLTLMQSLLPEIAGSGRMRYQSYLDQVNQFQRKWRELLWTREFFQIPLSSGDYDLIPRFRFVEGPLSTLLRQVWLPVLLLTAQAGLAVCFGLRLFRRYDLIVS